MPGSTFSARFVAEWTGLLIHLVSRYALRLAWAQGNNIYLVRENALKLAMGDPNSQPDYLLWLDSDNPPSIDGFEMLMGALDASPEVSIVGGWYRFFNPTTKQVLIAAGHRGKRQLLEPELLEADHLIEVDYIGFGFCLMRRQVIDDIGLEKCFEPLMLAGERRTWAYDDEGFCLRAQQHGHRVFVHPAVFSQHEKLLNVPSVFDERETPCLKEI